MLRKNTLLIWCRPMPMPASSAPGPWVFSIVGILLIGIFSASVVVPSFLVTQFQTSVTYLVASSLILTGLVQLAFTRFISDRLFEKQQDLVLPNLHGLLLVVLVVAGALGSLALFVVLPGQGLLYRLLMLAGFTLMCGVWVLTILLSGMKRYKVIVALFGLSYLLIVVSALLLRPYGLEGLLGALCWATMSCWQACGCWWCVNSTPQAASWPLTLHAAACSTLAHGDWPALQPGHLGGQVHVLVFPADLAGHHRRPAGLAHL